LFGRVRRFFVNFPWILRFHSYLIRSLAALRMAACLLEVVADL
jgi:hypothetical protein